MRTFILRRVKDPTGVSGTGDIAEGAEFGNGKVVVGWNPEKTAAGVPSVTVFDSIEEVEKVHGHAGDTVVVWTESRINPDGSTEAREYGPVVG